MLLGAVRMRGCGNRLAVALALVFVWADAGRAGGEGREAAPPDAGPRTGSFDVRFNERSPYSDYAELARRYGGDARAVPPYELADETFQVYLPAGYDGSEPYGLLVYIDPGGRGAVPRDDWRPVLDRRRIIWIGPDHAGNSRRLEHRLGLALDAAHNMPGRYRIDEDRVYISGMSGGGRCSSWLGLKYPEVFDGMLPICGVDYWTTLAVPDRPNTFWPQKFQRPRPGPNLVRVLRRNRHVLLTGSEDGNRLQTQVTAETMRQRHRFSHVHYIEVPDMGHALPSAEWFDRAIALLDEPLAASSDDPNGGGPD